MVKMTVLASGSKGNSAVVSSSRTRILVDAGLSCRELFKRMAAAGEDPRALSAILITHEHQDHVQGLAVAARKLGIPVYFTEPTHRAWMRWMMPRKRLTYADWLEQRRQQQQQGPEIRDQGPGAGATNAVQAATPDPSAPAAADIDPDVESAEARECAAEVEELLRPDQGAHPLPESAPAPDPCALPAVEYFRAGSRFEIGDVAVTPFTIPHDAADPVGFVFEAEGIRIGLATDLGYLPSNVQVHLRGCDILMIESNHDVEMLRDGPYPWSVKQRVMSRVGHLSNDAAAEFLEKNYDGYATYVILAHLSESNNLPELARVAAEQALRDRMSLLGNHLLLAEQRVPIASIVL